MRVVVSWFAALLLIVATSQNSNAGIVVVDIAGWETFAGFGNAANSEVRINIGAGSQVTAVEFDNVLFTTENGSWGSEFTLSVNNFNGTAYLDWSPSLTDAAGIFGPFSGEFGGSVGGPGPFGAGGPFTVDDGELWITVYEGFDDGGAAVRDAIVTSGTITVTYSVVPEPASIGLIGIVALGMIQVRRRRQ